MWEREKTWFCFVFLTAYQLLLSYLIVKFDSSVLYTLPMNTNGYVPFLINVLESIVKFVNMPTISGSGCYSVKASWQRCQGSLAFKRPALFSLKGLFSQSLTHLIGARFITWFPFVRGMLTGPQGIFGAARLIWTRALH